MSVMVMRSISTPSHTRQSTVTQAAKPARSRTSMMRCVHIIHKIKNVRQCLSLSTLDRASCILYVLRDRTCCTSSARREFRGRRMSLYGSALVEARVRSCGQTGDADPSAILRTPQRYGLVAPIRGRRQGLRASRLATGPTSAPVAFSQLRKRDLWPETAGRWNDCMLFSAVWAKASPCSHPAPLKPRSQ